MEWQPIETAPKGGGAETVTDPNYVKPPLILLLFKDDKMSIGYWEAYYAEGGAAAHDCPNGVAWCEPISGELLTLYYDPPTHWMPPPTPTGE